MCRLAEWVAFLHTTIMATVVMCRVRNPACTAASALGKERYINGHQEAPLTPCMWRYTNETRVHSHYVTSTFKMKTKIQIPLLVSDHPPS